MWGIPKSKVGNRSIHAQACCGQRKTNLSHSQTHADDASGRLASIANRQRSGPWTAGT